MLVFTVRFPFFVYKTLNNNECKAELIILFYWHDYIKNSKITTLQHLNNVELKHFSLMKNLMKPGWIPLEPTAPCHC